ncbi:MAG: peptidyl-prolyl cis-trans isomerase [Burkholderiales bacterium]|jgi:parvulin-like peptidyl-prolyl isomerase|nr:peptidyl-prolyl cis-trans isomerase [Burkholderiales bacterium]
MTNLLKRYLAVNALSLVLLIPGVFAAEAEPQNVSDATQEGQPVTLPLGVVARVNGTDITQEQLDAEVRKISPIALGRVTQEFVAAVKSQMIATELLRQEAHRQNLENDPSVQEAVRYAQSAAMVQAFVKKNVKLKAVTDTDIRGKYDDLISQLGSFEYKARTIEAPNIMVATVIEGELAKGVDFSDTARRYSSAKNQKDGGEMPWVSFKNPPQKGKTQGLSLPVAYALLTLSPGEYTSKPVSDETKYVFIKLEAMRPTQIPAYEEAKASIKQALDAQAAQEASFRMMEELMEKAVIIQ